MAGISVSIDVTGLRELIEQMEQAAGELRQQMEAALVEKSIEYDYDLRGPGPGMALTPYRTGRLQMSGNAIIDGLDLVFHNEAPYAEWARASGAPVGGYAADSGDAFAQRFGVELAEEWEALTAAALRGEGGA